MSTPRPERGAESSATTIPHSTCRAKRSALHVRSHSTRFAATAMLTTLLASGAMMGCSSVAPRKQRAATPSSLQRSVIAAAEIEARWIARPDAPFVRFVGASSAASWLLMAGTQRLELTASGKLRVAAQWLARSDYLVTELAPRLGGGFLFERRGDETLVERAPTYLGHLESVARLSLRVADLVQGLDRLYAVLDRTRDIVALDPHGKGAMSLGPLPEAPAYGPLAFADAWFGIVTVPFQGALATFDAGASWHRLGLSNVRSARVIDDGIEITHGAGASTLRMNGAITPAPSTETIEGSAPHNEDAAQGGQGSGDEQHHAAIELGDGLRSVLARRIGERLVDAALRGWPLDKRHALLLQGGDLLRVDLETAEAIERRERVAPVNANCHAAPLFSGAGFVCHTERESLLYEAFVNPLNARVVHRFATPRLVAAAGSGGAVVSGPCRGAPDTRDSRSWCIVPKTGAPWPISLEHFEDAARVVALASGEAAIVTPPGNGRRASLSIVSPSGAVKHRAELKLGRSSPKESEEATSHGLWLNGVTELEDGSLSGWLVYGESPMGVLIHRDGSIELGKPRGTVGSTLFTARSAVVLGNEGQGWQSRDGGQSWQSVPLPSLAVDANDESDHTLEARGCGLLGCVADGWVRIGWKTSKATNDLPVAEVAPFTALPLAGGGRWILDCVNKRRVPPVPRSTSHTSNWPGFFGLGAPQRRRGERGYSHVTQSGFMTLQGYAWGPASGPWHPDGRWSVRGLSGYDAPTDAWSTSTTVCPWSDEPSSAEAFARERPTGPPVVWSTRFDPDGRGGLLRIGSIVEADTYLLEAGRPLRRVRGEPVTNAFALFGAVRAQGSWFALSSVGSGIFALSRLDSGVAHEVMRLRDDSGVSSPTLVRNRAETALGLWVQDAKTRGAATRWFVYPIDPERDETGEALVIDDDVLGGSPRSCTEDDAGWVLEGPLPLGPSLDLGAADSRLPTPISVRARVVAGERGLCVESLMGVSSEKFVPAPLSASDSARRSRKPAAISLVLRDQDGAGDHWVFECLH